MSYAMQNRPAPPVPPLPLSMLNEKITEALRTEALRTEALRTEALRNLRSDNYSLSVTSATGSAAITASEQLTASQATTVMASPMPVHCSKRPMHYSPRPMHYSPRPTDTQQFEICTPNSCSPTNQGLQHRTSEAGVEVNVEVIKEGFGLPMSRTPPKKFAMTKSCLSSPSGQCLSSPSGKVDRHMPRLRYSSPLRKLLPVSVTPSAGSPASAYQPYSPATAYQPYSPATAYQPYSPATASAYPPPSHAHLLIGRSSVITHQPLVGRSPTPHNPCHNPWSCFRQLLRSSSETQLPKYPAQQSEYGLPPVVIHEPFTDTKSAPAPEQKSVPAPSPLPDPFDEPNDPFGFKKNTLQEGETPSSENKEERNSKTPKKGTKVKKNMPFGQHVEEKEADNKEFGLDEVKEPDEVRICNC